MCHNLCRFRLFVCLEYVRSVLQKPHFSVICCVLLVLSVTRVVSGQIVLNEVMPANTTTLSDHQSTYPDWIELYNAGSASLALEGYGLSDDADEPFKWTFPSLTMAPQEFLVVFASGVDAAQSVVQWSTLIDQGHIWHYWTSRQQPISTWTDPGFPVTAWATGPSGFGYGDGDDATIINPNPSLALFTRTTFSIADVDGVEQLILHVDYDDAFVAYVNGTEVARANIGTPGGARPSITTPADGFGEPFGIQGLQPPSFLVSNPGDILLEGENVLAIQVHNSSTTSSDLTLIPFLTVGLNTTQTSLPSVSSHLANETIFQSSLHAGFKLNAEGEALFLTAPDATPVDSVVFGEVPQDISYGRSPTAPETWGFMSTPTPGQANTAIATAIAEAPVFDMPGARYPAAVTVSVQSPTPGATIRYTIDGRLPTENDQAIRNGSLVVLTSRVVRARTFAPGMLPSPVVTHTYALNQNTSLPIVAITSEPDNFWDQDTGVYVMGRNANSNFPHFGANFWEDWEIPVHLELFEDDGTRGYSAHAGLKIFGGWSRGFAQKSFSLFARAAYGERAFDHSFFANRPYERYQALVLRNSGNDWTSTMMRDGVLQTLVRDLDIDGLAHRPTVVFINGEYWGIQNLREKINEHYVAQVGSTAPDAIDLLEYVPDTGPVALHGSTDVYQTLVADLQADLTSEAAYNKIVQQLDIDSFIDYQLAQIYFDNRDWPGNNNKLWRPRSAEGRWRWILYDTDFGFGIWNDTAYRSNTLAFATEANGPNWPNPPWSTFVLRRLLTSPMFRQAFINRFADLMNGPFATEAVYAVIDSMQANIAAEMPKHVDRWGGRSLQEWSSAVNSMRSFALNRPGAMNGHMTSRFGLGSLATINVDVNNPSQGIVVVNRLQPHTFPWLGRYYRDITVPITAKPKPGYHFVRWSGAETSTASTVWVTPTPGMVLTAHFEPGTSASAQIRINEIHYHPADDMDSDSWIELVNPSAEAVPLEGWVFKDGNDNNAYTFPPSSTIDAGGYLVVVGNPEAFTAVYPTTSHIGGWTFGLSNSGEAVRLFDETGAIIDSLTYDDALPWPIGADGEGSSLERISPELPSSDPATWQASNNAGGTPGAPNSTQLVSNEQESQPASITLLSSPYPNPFTTATALTYQLAEPGHVMLDVYDALGRRITTLNSGLRHAGMVYTVHWEDATLSPGVYFFRLSVEGKHQQTKSAIRVR